MESFIMEGDMGTWQRKTIRVVASIIMSDGMVFAAKRDYGELKGYWEFPGGKIEEGESPKEALKREIEEELGTEIEVGEFFMNEQYDYPSFHLDMDVFFCKVIDGSLVAEKGIHEDCGFIALDGIVEKKWCPADREIATKLLAKLKQ